MKRLFFCLAVGLMVALNGFAAESGPDLPDLYTHVDIYDVTYRINPDASFTVTRKTAITVLKESAIASAKSTSITYSTSIQTSEIVEAYTQKKDGRRIPVPRNNYQLKSNTGHNKNGPVFSDLTTLTVVFPDVEVGDTVVHEYRLIAREPMYPGRFSVSERFSRHDKYDQVRIRIEAPKSMWAQYRVNELEEHVNEETDALKILEWRYSNPSPSVSKRQDFSVYDPEREPGIAYSTFLNNEDLAVQYGLRAKPKAIPTERVRKLADELTKNLGDDKAVARALYEWVALNITYAGHCIGIGAVVPHDTDFILDNRMGDCKDHATLLEALLAAKGIPSTQALINAGSIYKLDRIPLASMVNHVINYLPTLELFVDSTSNDTPFGMLPFGDMQKPVLLVDGHKEGLKTPSLPIGSNRQEMVTRIAVRPDGTVSGRSEVTLKGMQAVSARARMRYLSKDVERNFIRDAYRSQGLIASGVLDKDDPTALSDHYRYAVDFEIKNFLPLPGPAAFGIGPFIGSELAVSSLIAGALQADEEAPESTCVSGFSSEIYEYTLPKGMKVLALPPNLKMANELTRFEASYSIKGNVLRIRRQIDDRTPGHVCNRSRGQQDLAFARKILPNLKAQVLFK